MQSFVTTEFNTWKSEVDNQEKLKPQTERVNTRTSYTYHYDSEYSYHVDYHSDNHSDGMVYVPADHNWYHVDQGSGYYHTDIELGWAGYGSKEHSDSGSSNHTDYNSWGGSSYYSHHDVGFVHNDFVPSTPRIYRNEITEPPQIRDTVTIGFHSYDKNNDGFGTQDARSKTVEYLVRVRQIKNIDGSAKVSAWRILSNYGTAQTVALNTIDPLATGNTNGKLTEGFYEIEVTARNTAQSLRGVTQTYVSPVLTKQVKIQQNIEPELSLTNSVTFIDFTFGRDTLRTKAGEILDYNTYASRYNLDQYNGILANIVVTERDKDQYLKGTGWIENASGVKVAGTEFDIVWENGAKSIKTDGIADFTGQLFIPNSTLRNIPSGNHIVAVQVKDYLDPACLNPAGATITQKTISKTNSTSLSIGIDMVLPIATFDLSDGNWNLNKSVTVQLTDDFVGIERWRYRILTDGVVTANWSNYRTTSTETISLPTTGRNIIEVEVMDKAGNTHTASSNEFKIDKQVSNLSFTLSPSTWTPDTVTITATGTDAHSGVKRIQKPDGTWTTGNTATYTVSTNGSYKFTVEDNVGNVQEQSITVTNIDDIIPEVFNVKAINVNKKSIEVEITEMKDLQSGLNVTPYTYSKDNGATWSAWTTNTKFEFTNLNLNTNYPIRVKIRDKANNERISDVLNVSTLTEDIKLNYSRVEGSNEVTLNVDLNGNPANTEIMITRQNMITNELVIIKDWSTGTTYKDRVNNFVVGYRYSAYARNRDKIIGNSDNITIKDIETPDIRIKGFGGDKYLYDKDTQSIFIFGNPTGYIEFFIKTLSTEKLIYEVKDGLEVVNKEGNLYGRHGDYEYSFNTKISNVPKQEFTLTLKAEYENSDTESLEVKNLKVPNPKITVYQINSLSNLLDFNIGQSGESMSVRYSYKTSFENSTYQEIMSKAKIRDLLKDLNVSTDSSKVVARDTTTLLTPGDLMIEKVMEGGTYTETFKQNSVIVSTNISPFITLLESNWKLEVYVTTSKGRYTLPRDLAKFQSDGFKIDVFLAKNKTIATGTSLAENYSDVSASGTVWNLNSDILNSATLGMFGIKVTDVLPTYLVTNLNLQTQENAANTTLDAVGNSNIKYDKSFIYNRMNNKMKVHEETIFKDNAWVGTLYYRTDNATNLILITPTKIKVIAPSTLDTIKEVSTTNKGSLVLGANLYIGTSTGLKLVTADGTVKSTSFNKNIIEFTSQGSDLFIASNDGLYILDSSLNEKQFLSNTVIFGSDIQIKTLYTSNGNIYVSKDLKGNEYVVIGK